MFFAGMAKGFSEALAGERQQAAQKAERDAAREDAILQHLTTSDDPEIASMALTGLLSKGSAQKPAKGLRGFLGEMQGNPMLPTIRDLISRGREVPTPGKPIPMEPPQGEVPPALAAVPEAQGGAALPAGGPTQPGSQPMARPMPAAQAPPGPVQFNEGPSEGSTTVPRQVFMPPAEKAAAAEEAQYTGRARAYEKMSPAARAAILPGRVQTSHSVTDKDGNVTVYDNMGNIVQQLAGAGKPTPVNATTAKFNEAVKALRATNPNLTEAAAQQQVLTEQRQATVTGAATATARLSAVNQGLLNAHEQLQGIRLNNQLRERVLNGQLNYKEALGIATNVLRMRPDATTDDVNSWVESLMAGGGGAAGGASAAPESATTPGPPAPPAAGAAGATATPSPTAAVAPPAPGTAPGATPTRAQLPPRQPFGKLGAQEQKTLEVIGGARLMMDNVMRLLQGREQQNSIGAKVRGLMQAGQAGLGFSPSDPTYKELDTALQHLQVFSTSPYLQGIRAGAYVKKVMENTPNITDTPMRMMDKLRNLKLNFDMIESEIGAPKPVVSHDTSIHQPQGVINAAAAPPGAEGGPLRKAIPSGNGGGTAESTDGGKTWHKVQ